MTYFHPSPEKPLVIDLFCGLGGWAEGFLAEGYAWYDEICHIKPVQSQKDFGKRLISLGNAGFGPQRDTPLAMVYSSPKKGNHLKVLIASLTALLSEKSLKESKSAIAAIIARAFDLTIFFLELPKTMLKTVKLRGDGEVGSIIKPGNAIQTQSSAMPTLF